MKKILSLLSVLVLALAFVACERRPLEEEWMSGDYADILLLTDWNQLEEVPTGLTYIFYPVGADGKTDLNKHVVSNVSNNINRNVVRLSQGKYHLLVFNQSVNEFGTMSFSGMEAIETACASLNPLRPNYVYTAEAYKWLSSVLKDQDSLSLAMREPEPFNAYRQYDYEVTAEMVQKQYYFEQGLKAPDGMNQDEYVPDLVEWYADTIYSEPTPVPPTMYIEARVKGIDNAYEVRAYITDMARADLFGPHTNTPEPCIHVLDNWEMVPNSDNKKMGYIRTKFRTFGVPNLQVTTDDTRAIEVIPYGTNTLVFEFKLRDGSTVTFYDFDVTHDIEYTEEGLRLDLVLDTDPNAGGGGGSGGSGGDPDDPYIVLPDVPDVIGTGGAGFDATVEDWKHEDHTIQF